MYEVSWSHLIDSYDRMQSFIADLWAPDQPPPQGLVSRQRIRYHTNREAKGVDIYAKPRELPLENAAGKLSFPAPEKEVRGSMNLNS